MIRARAVLLLLLVTIAALLAGCNPAFAEGPVTNYFQHAYDYRYETPYSCYGQTCWTSVYTDAASYYNAPVLTSMKLRRSIDGAVNSDNYAPAVGQNTGVMCWKASPATGAIWLTVDARHLDDEGNSGLYIGWILDADVRLSYTNRVTYVPECGYYKTITARPTVLLSPPVPDVVLPVIYRPLRRAADGTTVRV